MPLAAPVTIACLRTAGTLAGSGGRVASCTPPRPATASASRSRWRPCRWPPTSAWAGRSSASSGSAWRRSSWPNGSGARRRRAPTSTTSPWSPTSAAPRRRGTSRAGWGRRDPLPERRAAAGADVGARGGAAVLRAPVRRRPAAPGPRPPGGADGRRGRGPFELMAANLCDSGRLLAQHLHLSGAVALALGQFTERWDGTGFPGTRPGRRSRSRCGSSASRTISSPSPTCATGRPRSRRSGAAPGATTRRWWTPRSPTPRGCSTRRSPRPLGARHRRRAGPVATISRAGLTTVARAFGEFADSRSTSCTGTRPGSAELAATRRRGARLLARRGVRGSRRGLLPRPRPGGGAERDLGQARPVERGRAGAGAASSLLHRARARAIRRARAARAGRRLASRATGRLRLPPRFHGRAAERRARGCWPRPTSMTR